MLPVTHTHTHMHTNIPERAARGKWHLFSLWWAPHVLDLIHSISQHLGGTGGCMTRGSSGGKGDERAVVYKCALVMARWVGSYQKTSQPKQHLKLPPRLLPPSITFSLHDLDLSLMLYDNTGSRWLQLFLHNGSDAQSELWEIKRCCSIMLHRALEHWKAVHWSQCLR